jgi:hypothetical protein
MARFCVFKQKNNSTNVLAKIFRNLNTGPRSKEVTVEFICVDEPGKLSQDDLQVLNDAAAGIQRAQRITGNQKCI